MGTRWEKRKGELERKIVETAIQLFRAGGFEATTMEGIAEATEIAKGTLYKYFPNKEAIINKYRKLAVQDGESELQEIISMEPDTYSRLLKVMIKINKWNEEHKDILRMNNAYRLNDLLSTKGQAIKESTLEATLLRIIRPAYEKGELRNDISAESLVRYFMSLYATYFLGWLYDGENNLGKAGLEEIVQLFLYGARK
ncbi:MAG: hypothetical protein JM58_15105 [Peptococcaceae bacterium BICA1-8]|nr:MAG: hypothetical protein JM58_15105 [Peptococcaceae bacterium BICA1-8]